MAGLLDFLGDDNARFSLGLLAAAGPRFDGANEGQRIQEALGGFDAYKQKQTQSQMQKMQMEQMQNQMARQKQMEELAKRYATPGAPSLAPIQGDAILPDYLKSGILPSAGQAAKPAGFDFQGYAQSMAAIDPMESLKLQQALQKDETPITLKEGESLLDRKTYKPIFSLPKAEAAPAAVKEYQFAVGQGYKGSFQQFQIEQKKAGATNVSNQVSVAGPENQYNKDIGAGLAKDSLTVVEIAKAAPEVVTNARSIKAALVKDAITGTAAEQRLAIQRAAETLGIAKPGKAASTEELMAGLSKLTLSGIKTSGLGGGNGFTDKDREFLNAAIGGQISNTPANLRRVADLSERVAIANYKKGQAVVQRWQGDPALRAVVQDTQLGEIPAQSSGAPTKTVVKTGTYQGRKVVQYDDGTTAYAD
jgi:hypothetical protein